MEVKEFKAITRSVEETRRLGRALGRAAVPGMVMALQGPLGAGKTHFTQGIAEGLGVSDDEYVASPTFVVVMEHLSGRMPLYHVDLYRLEEPEEAGEIGLFDMMASDGLTVVEWADRFPELFPPDTIWVRISIEDSTTREFTFSVPATFSDLAAALSSTALTE